MPKDYIRMLDELPQPARNRLGRFKIITVGIISCVVGICAAAVFAKATEPAPDLDLLPKMVASVALYQGINPMALWSEVATASGKPYQNWSRGDHIAAIERLGRRMELPPRQGIVDLLAR